VYQRREDRTLHIECSISGLESRVLRPLEFLGIYHMRGNTEFYDDPPASNLASEQWEISILGRNIEVLQS
jgi:hypothetical protein